MLLAREVSQTAARVAQGPKEVRLTIGAVVSVTIETCPLAAVGGRTSFVFVEQTASAVDCSANTLVKTIDHVPALLLHDVADKADDGQAVLASLPLVVLSFD